MSQVSFDNGPDEKTDTIIEAGALRLDSVLLLNRACWTFSLSSVNFVFSKAQIWKAIGDCSPFGKTDFFLSPNTLAVAQMLRERLSEVQ